MSVVSVINNFFRHVRYSGYILYINWKIKGEKIKFIDSKNNTLTPLFNKYGSDKGNLNNKHNYSNVYESLFYKLRNKKLNLMEIGLGSVDQNIDFHMKFMGKDYKPLASLYAWRDYFDNAIIYGADIDKKILKNHERIKTYFVDQTDPKTIELLFKNIGISDFDVILDDGLHEYNANICLFENSIKFLSNSGIYIIEDVYFKDKQKFINYLNNSDYNYSIVDIYHKKNITNKCGRRTGRI